MKKILIAIMLLFTMVFSLTSCSLVGTIFEIVIGMIGELDEVITSEGEGLPTEDSGVYDIDFTLGNIKNVTEQGSYLDGCPTVGEAGVLVIPVEFSDVTAESKGYKTEAIANAFMKDGKCDYYSVYDYYYISSYGQLSLDITVLDFWFKPEHKSSYYEKKTMNYYGDKIQIGDQMVLDEALEYLSGIMDLSKFDSDGNGIIDSVVMINTLDIGDDDFHWAYRYWNYYTDKDGYYYEYDGVSANDYLWASYQFLYQSYDEDGYECYDDVNAMNTYTYIHEFGHILGADDYYDTDGILDPMDGLDMMDAMNGDHNPFTKINYGWITKSRLVVADESVTLSLFDFSTTGDTIILANDWDIELGAYQEYYIIMYYTQNGLNGGDAGYFARDGIVVYHVNSSLYKYKDGGTVYYDIYNTNSYYDGNENLIEFVMSENDTYTFVVGDALGEVQTDTGASLAYTFTVDSIEDGEAILTFTKR